eukprot:366245-Chlamydomonas_euryale.AAC.39
MLRVAVVQDEVFGAPPPLPADASDASLIKSVSDIVGIMVNRGYALKGSVEPLPPGEGNGFTVTLQGPANLWGVSSLSFRRSPVVNNFDQMVVDAYLRACGRAATVESSYGDRDVQHTWLLAA